jgi:CBS-domain-containing membrane protein
MDTPWPDKTDSGKWWLVALVVSIVAMMVGVAVETLGGSSALVEVAATAVCVVFLAGVFWDDLTGRTPPPDAGKRDVPTHYD